MKQVNIAVVGALGAVGREIIKILEKSNIPVGELVPLDVAELTGTPVQFRGKTYLSAEASAGAFEGVDAALFSAGGDASEVLAPIAVSEGAVVIDNSSCWRMDPGVPLVIPEVNPEALKHHNGIIANPNCSTIQMLVAVAPIHRRYKIRRIVVSTYQAVSGSGLAAVNELKRQSKAVINGDLEGASKCSVYPHQIAFNAIPHIDVFVEDGYTKEEMKMVDETRKILDSSIEVSPTAVRIPVFRGHSESVNLETEEPIDIEEVKHLLSSSPGVVLQDDTDNNSYPLAYDSEGKDGVFVGRVRRDMTVRNGLNMWVVSDNLRKGAALNAVQILQLMYEGSLL